MRASGPGSSASVGSSTAQRAASLVCVRLAAITAASSPGRPVTSARSEPIPAGDPSTQRAAANSRPGWRRAGWQALQEGEDRGIRGQPRQGQLLCRPGTALAALQPGETAVVFSDRQKPSRASAIRPG